MSEPVEYETVWTPATWREIEPDAAVLEARARAYRASDLRAETHRVDAAVDGVWRSMAALADRSQLDPKILREALRRRIERKDVERMAQPHPGIKSGTCWLYRRVRA